MCKGVKQALTCCMQLSLGQQQAANTCCSVEPQRAQDPRLRSIRWLRLQAHHQEA